MKLYSAKVRIGGNSNNEVVKNNLTAAEIHILQKIHSAPGILGGGNHAPVVDIIHTADTNRSDAKERARLAAEYTSGELTSDNGKRLLESLFGVTGALPQAYVEPTVEAIETIVPIEESDEEVVPVSAPVRTRTLKKDDTVSVVG